jgi:hypothetical protein
MEGSFFVPQGRPRRAPDLCCSECGAAFRPRRVTDGIEELCDDCYSTQFASHHPKQSDGPTVPTIRPLAAD